jgi:hypothetical protein
MPLAAPLLSWGHAHLLKLVSLSIKKLLGVVAHRICHFLILMQLTAAWLINA